MTISSMSAGGSSQIGTVAWPMPALLIQWSILPRALVAEDHSASTWSGSATSQGKPRTLEPGNFVLKPAATASADSLCLPEMTTPQPRERNSCASLRPRPRVDPVMTILILCMVHYTAKGIICGIVRQVPRPSAYAPFTARAVRVIRAIPRGKVATYGLVAALAGSPLGARQVVRVLHSPLAEGTAALAPGDQQPRFSIPAARCRFRKAEGPAPFGGRARDGAGQGGFQAVSLEGPSHGPCLVTMDCEPGHPKQGARASRRSFSCPGSRRPRRRFPARGS